MSISATTNLTIRMDADFKSRAEEFFLDLGMTPATACNIFLKQALREGRIPFEIGYKEPNETTINALIEGETLLADKKAKSFSSVDELFADLEK